MEYPSELRYSKTHEWLKSTEKGTVLIGITDYAQHELGDLVFINLPDRDEDVTAGEVICDVESVKAVSDIYSPVTGVIVDVNEELLDEPQLINSAPYESWFIEVGDIEETEELLDAAAYEEFCGKGG